MNFHQNSAQDHNAPINLDVNILFPNHRIVKYGNVEIKLTIKQWNLLFRLQQSPTQTLSLGDASEPFENLKSVWNPNQHLRINNMRNMASKINAKLTQAGIPYHVSFHKDGLYFELVCLLNTDTNSITQQEIEIVPEQSTEQSAEQSIFNSGSKSEPTLSSKMPNSCSTIDLLQAAIVPPEKIDDICSVITTVFDDIFVKKNDTTLNGVRGILIAVVNSHSEQNNDSKI
ncbi:MAG: hypothetical protein LBQ50_14875 [Planctomycetaceae bacterium]|jgi:hypothetical protein|nr:hypothetical protein [Planctomycetaceae bacterium]